MDHDSSSGKWLSPALSCLRIRFFLSPRKTFSKKKAHLVLKLASPAPLVETPLEVFLLLRMVRTALALEPWPVCTKCTTKYSPFRTTKCLTCVTLATHWQRFDVTVFPSTTPFTLTPNIQQKIIHSRTLALHTLLWCTLKPLLVL